MAGNYEDNIFWIGDFDDSLERDVILPLTLEIRRQMKRADGKIDLYINSMGGYGHLLFHMVDLVEMAKRQGVTVRTIVMDSAFSAGSMLAVAGTQGERYIAKTASHLVHYGSIASFEQTPEQIERYRKWKQRFFANNVSHYKKYADIPNLEEHIKDDGFFVTAAEAIKWKMADRYTDKLEM
jgi:ATP-dependent protease ClpP protease subunit